MRVTVKIKGYQAPEDRHAEYGGGPATFANLRRVEMDRKLAVKTLRHIADQIEQNERAS